MSTIKGFREFLSDVEAEEQAKVARGHGRLAIYHVSTDDLVASTLLKALLMEALPRIDLGKGRSILFHKAHVPDTEDHLHFLVKGRKFAAINKSGTAHDQSHGVQLQRWAINGARQHYSDFKLPPDGLIEQLYSDDQAQLLVESAGGFTDGVSGAAQTFALTMALKSFD